MVEISSSTSIPYTSMNKGQTHDVEKRITTRPLDEARRRDPSELDRGNEAEETGQVRVNPHGSRDQ